MTDELEPLADPSPAEFAALGKLLARADVWDDPPDELEDVVVDSVTRAVAVDSSDTVSGTAPVTVLDGRRRRSRPTWWLGAAASLVVVIAGVALVTRGGTVEGTEVELTGSERSPGASGVAILSTSPAGLKIVLDAEGLDGAPVGFMYEVWLTDGAAPVSCGTFHQRGESGTIELWAGVSDPAYDRLAITLEPLDGDTASSGDVRLSGTFTLDD
jgi:hypothetical protein